MQQALLAARWWVRCAWSGRPPPCGSGLHARIGLLVQSDLQDGVRARAVDVGARDARRAKRVALIDQPTQTLR